MFGGKEAVYSLLFSDTGLEAVSQTQLTPSQ